MGNINFQKSTNPSTLNRFLFKKTKNKNRKGFFPAMGNHDYDDENRTGQEFLTYFSFLGKLLGNTSNQKKYYDFKIYNCHFFILDSDPVCGSSDKNGNIFASYPAGKGDANLNTTSNANYVATQKTWFNNTIKNSNSKYKFVFYHHPSYSSGSFHKGYPKLSAHQGWKVHLANAVFHGHEHLYERIALPFQLPQHVQVTKISNQLKIEYSSQGNLHVTSQLRIHIGNDGWQNIIDANTVAGYMEKVNNIWTFYYNIPSGADYINFVFRSEGGTWENNTINNENYDYIYYLNDSNQFDLTTYSIVGNGGRDLRNFNSPILGSQSRISNKYGFTKVTIYENGFKNEHYGIGSGETNFSIVDSYSYGDITTEVKFTFAIIADWGYAFENDSLPLNFTNPNNNYYPLRISQEIKNQNIPFIFGVGDLSYNNGVLKRPDNSHAFAIDENVGQFYHEYISSYRGIYNSDGLDSEYFNNGFKINYLNENYLNDYNI